LTHEEYTSSELRFVGRDTANRRCTAQATIRHGRLAVSWAAIGMPTSDGFDAEHAARNDRSRGGAASRDRAAVASAITFTSASGELLIARHSASRRDTKRLDAQIGGATWKR